ncbi:hypothetical protein DFA_01697 [Cavenderia fasciculata]|uniref:FAD-binding domain-containing protein n=1 Tax=Cavenderia fasciculata TaxID=261658 RepID=F4PU96_CACFS|nr:uncharacterized protein DFA_01697 [Cavenderia fasciculata]EGG21811.1 hypothetical protein DFA_01697 [Cavenderia fasciculata]|eukprot:XP_004359661.1 hypothetical protein DFA_01697 [Cavenderia fasciculata]
MAPLTFVEEKSSSSTLPLQDLNEEEEYQVVIVGCGPNGSVMANLLGMYGIKTLVVEASDTIYNLPRAAHLDDEAIRILQFIGLDELMKQNSLKLDVKFNRKSQSMTYLTIKNTETVYGHPRSIFWYQPELEQILVNGFQRFGEHMVKLLLGHRMVRMCYDQKTKTNRVEVVDNETGHVKNIRCNFVIGADGGNSTVRKSMSSNLHGESGSMRWLVIDATLDSDHPKINDYFQFVCDPKLPMVSCPLPGNHFRWEFAIADGQDEDEFIAGSDRLIELYGGDLSKLKNRVADRWFDGESRFIIGDAAHCLPQFLGMGVSSGMRDSINLAWKLKMALDNINEPYRINTAALLDSYALERKPEVELIGNKSNRIGNAVMSTNIIASTIRDLFSYILLLMPFIQTIFTNNEMKPIVPIKEGIIDHGHATDQYYDKKKSSPWKSFLGFLVIFYYALLQWSSSSSSSSSRKNTHKKNVGHRIVQPNIIMNNNNNNNNTMKLDSVMGLGFSCFVVNATDNTFSLLNTNSSIWKLLNTSFITIGQNNSSSSHWKQFPSIQIQRDQDKPFNAFIGNNMDGDSIIVIVRPDKHIFGIYKGDNEIATISNSLQNTFLIN